MAASSKRPFAARRGIRPATFSNLGVRCIRERVNAGLPSSGRIILVEIRGYGRVIGSNKELVVPLLGTLSEFITCPYHPALFLVYKMVDY